MTKILKCNSCNLVVDELLAFVQNKLDTMDEESLSRICVSAFTPKEIASSKKLLYEVVPVQSVKIARKGAGKEHRDIADIINSFKSTDPELYPVFVAKDLHKLPPVTFDHVDVTALLKDIVLLKTTVEQIKSSYVSKDAAEELFKTWVCKEDFQHSNQNSPVFGHPNVKNKRGGYLNLNLNQSNSSLEAMSGPMGLSYVHGAFSRRDITVSNGCQVSVNTAQQEKALLSPSHQCGDVFLSPSERVKSPTSDGVKEDEYQEFLNEKETSVSPGRFKERLSLGKSSTIRNVHILSDNTNQLKQTSPHASPQAPQSQQRQKMADVVRGGVWNNKESRAKPYIPNVPNYTTSDMDWEVAGGRKQRRRSRGLEGRVGKAESVTSGGFKAAEGKRINIRDKRKDHTAYKMFVSKFKVAIFLDETLWPEGIIFRRFVHFKPQALRSKQPQPLLNRVECEKT